MSLLLLLTQPNLQVVITDSLGLTDAGRAASISGSTTDGTGLTDSVSTSLGAITNVSLTDGTGLTDTNQAVTIVGSTTDSTGLTDSVTPTVSGPVVITQNITDSTGLTDANRAITRLGSTTDNRGFTDTVTPALIGPTGFAVTPTDSAGRTDSITVDRITTINLVDTLVITEDTTDGYIDIVESVTDSTGLVDSAVSEKTSSPIPVEDLLALRDQMSVTFLPSVTDSAGRSDSIAVSISITLTDGLGVSDFTTVAQSPGSILVTTSTENTGLTDSVTVTVSNTTLLYPTDLLGLSDYITVSTDTRTMRLKPDESLLFVDARYGRRRRRDSRWIGVYGHMSPWRTEAGLLLWRDGRVQIVREWPIESDADAMIGGGHEWQGAENSWEAQVLRDAGFTLEPVP